MKIPIIGIIENMVMIKSLFIKSEIIKMELPYIGYISFDENIENSIGEPHKLKETDFMKELNNLLKRINL